MTSATGYSIIILLGVAGCGFLSLGIYVLKHIEGFSRWRKLGSRRNLIVEYFNIITNYAKVRSENMGKEGKDKQACVNNILNDAEIA